MKKLLSENILHFSGLDYSSQYSDLGDEAHKKGAVSVGAPALISHIGFYLEDDASNNGKQDSESRGSIISNARNVLDLLHTRSMEGQKNTVQAPTFFPSDDKKVRQTNHLLNKTIAWSTTDTESVFCKIDNHMVKIIVEVHSDYFTVTSIADFSKRPPIDTAELRHFRSFDSVDMSEAMSACAQAFQDYMAHVIHPEDPVRRETAVEAKDVLHEKFWTELFEIIFGTLTQHIDRRMRIFADFRGIVLQEQRQIDFFSSERPMKPRRPTPSKIDVDTAIKILMPVFNLGDNYLHMRELVACTMLRDQVVYMSPLGSSVVAGNREPQKGVRVPVFFALCVSEINRWQIGRLVHRINTLGTLRLLALRDLQSIRISSLQIRSVGQKLDSVKILDPIDTSDIHSQLSEIAQDINEIGKDINGGLAYRVYRSAFCSETFKNLVQDLDVKRIEGWQPYDEFVRRRLYSAYDFIARVGDRMNRLHRRLQSKFSEVHMTSFRNNTETIADIQDKIHDSHNIQHVIELIAVGYYGGYILYYITKFASKKFPVELPFEYMFGETWMSDLINAFRTDTEKGLLGACLFVSLIAGIAWFRYRTNKHKQDIHDRREKRGSVSEDQP